MPSSIEFRLNDIPSRAESFSAQTTLLEFLRSRGLTGAKEGCAEGECGACAVIAVAPRDGGSVYRSVNSCLVPLPSIQGQEVYTVEALSADGKLAEVQQAMVDNAGSQCGYCTPGFVVSLFAEQYRPNRNGPCDPHALSGNLCRCTGYRPIASACQSVGPAPDDAYRQRLEYPAPTLTRFEYESDGGRFSRPTTVAECIALLESDPQAKLVAGNTDLGLATNLQDKRFPHLISVEALQELRTFMETDDSVEIGAGLTLTEIADRWRHAPDVFHEWLPLFASPLIRNRATLGGNLATASPIGDSAPMLLALDAELKIVGSSGERYVSLSTFFRDYRQTLLARNEVIVSVEIPKPFPKYARFYKIAKRRTDDISTVAACIAQHKQEFRIGLGGVAPTPLRLIAFDLEAAAQALPYSIKPISDHRGSAAWRMQLAQSLLEKFAYERAA